MIDRNETVSLPRRLRKRPLESLRPCLGRTKKALTWHASALFGGHVVTDVRSPKTVMTEPTKKLAISTLTGSSSYAVDPKFMPLEDYLC